MLCAGDRGQDATRVGCERQMHPWDHRSGAPRRGAAAFAPGAVACTRTRRDARHPSIEANLVQYGAAVSEIGAVWRVRTQECHRVRHGADGNVHGCGCRAGRSPLPRRARRLRGPISRDAPELGQSVPIAAARAASNRAPLLARPGNGAGPGTKRGHARRHQENPRRRRSASVLESNLS